MRTPEELEEPDGRDECALRLPWETLAARAGRSPYFSLCWSMAGAGQQEPGGMNAEASWAGPSAATAPVTGGAWTAQSLS